MKIKDLKHAPYNPRKISREKLLSLKDALLEYGNLSGIVKNRRSGNLISGHQRCKVIPPDAEITITDIYDPPTRTGTVAEGYIMIDDEKYYYREVDWPIEKEKAANIAANQQGGEFDDELLSTLVKELSEIPDFDTALLGFDDNEITTLLNSITKEGQIEDDEVPEVPEKPITKTGDLYLLGNHRLLCGDSTKREDVERLMDRKKAKILLTDPPYAVDYVGKARDMNRLGYGHSRATLRSAIQSDEVDGKQEEKLWLESFTLAFDFIDSHSAIYIWHASSRAMIPLLNLLASFDLLFHQTIIWVKNNFVIGRCDYQAKHESCWYGWKKGSRPPFYGAKNQTTVWNIARDTNKPDHPTQKPIAILEPPLLNHLLKNEITYDPFLGSGSTLIACEKTGRICYGMEIDPHYCDVIVTRYCKFTGNNKIIKNNKEIEWLL